MAPLMALLLPFSCFAALMGVIRFVGLLCRPGLVLGLAFLGEVLADAHSPPSSTNGAIVRCVVYLPIDPSMPHSSPAFFPDEQVLVLSSLLPPLLLRVVVGGASTTTPAWCGM